MHVGLGLILFVICIFLLIQTSQGLPRGRPRIFRRHLENLFVSSTQAEPILFFQNEPVPLASSVVDDLTTLASTVYIISLIIVVFVLLAWVTHYNAPCSSVIASLLSAITGLPEPIIHSVALCGSCCIWCETTWLFRRIHQFNIWISSTIKQFVSVTCKVLYDSICPCCRPPDTPSNRSIIGSLPGSIIAMINIPDAPTPSPPKPIVTILEPTSTSPRALTVNVDVYAQPTTESLTRPQGHLASNGTLSETKTNPHQKNSKKRRKQPRKRTQLKQRSVIGESSFSEEEQFDHMSEDEEEDEEDENIKIY